MRKIKAATFIVRLSLVLLGIILGTSAQGTILVALDISDNKSLKKERETIKQGINTKITKLRQDKLCRLAWLQSLGFKKKRKKEIAELKKWDDLSYKVPDVPLVYFPLLKVKQDHLADQVVQVVDAVLRYKKQRSSYGVSTKKGFDFFPKNGVYDIRKRVKVGSYRSLVALLEAIDQMGEGLPFHWNFPPREKPLFNCSVLRLQSYCKESLETVKEVCEQEVQKKHNVFGQLSPLFNLAGCLVILKKEPTKDITVLKRYQTKKSSWAKSRSKRVVSCCCLSGKRKEKSKKYLMKIRSDNYLERYRMQWAKTKKRQKNKLKVVVVRQDPFTNIGRRIHRPILKHAYSDCKLGPERRL